MMGEIVGTREKAGALTPESHQSLCQLKNEEFQNN